MLEIFCTIKCVCGRRDSSDNNNTTSLQYLQQF